MKITYVIEVEPKYQIGDIDTMEKIMGGIILNFLEENFKTSKIGIYRGIKRLKGTTHR